MPSKRQNRVEKKLNSSKRTGTVPRKKKKYNVPKDKKLSRKDNTTHIKLLDISMGMSVEHDFIKEKIENNVNDALIFEMNEHNIKIQHMALKNVAMLFNKNNFPQEISQYILSMCLNNVYIERNIFNLLPRDMIHIFHKRGVCDVNNEEIECIMRNYTDKAHTYNFLYYVLKSRRRRFIGRNFRYWHDYNYVNNL